MQPRRRRALARALRVLLVVLAVPLLSGSLTGCTPPMKYVTASGFKYKFENWDYDTNTSKPDNPVSLIFVSNSSNVVGRVYSQMAGKVCGFWGCGNGGSIRLRGVGGSRPGVTADDPWTSNSNGQKTDVGCGICRADTDIHLRLYGPNGQQGTQVYQGSYGSWQYYALGTIHLDVNEGNPNTKDFGYSNEARLRLLDAMDNDGTWTYQGSVWVDNKCDVRLDDHHRCAHDGYAWVISIA